MSKENVELDELDSLLDDLGTPSTEQEPDELNSRDAITDIGKGALDAVLDNDNIGKWVAEGIKGSLPEGYNVALEKTDETLSETVGLYNSTIKSLEKPLDRLRKAINANVDALPSFISDDIKNKIREATKKVGNGPTSDKLDPDRAAIDASLKNIFHTQAEQARLDSEDKKLDRAILEKGNEINALSVRTLDTISNSLLKLVSYNDTINYRYQQKSIELQHLHYFASRDLLKLLVAYTDSDNNLAKSIVHNTSLPDHLKESFAEGFTRQERLGLYSTISEQTSKVTQPFLDKLSSNVEDKIKSKLGSAGLNIDMLSDLLNSSGQGGNVSTSEKLSIAGKMIVEEGMDKINPRIASKLKKLLESNPSIRSQSDKILYAMENAPAYVNTALDGWDGRVLPNSILDRFPALSKLNLGRYKSDLRDIVPGMENQELKANTSLLDKADTPVPFTEGVSRSIVEIIPGLLSRQLQMQEALVTGKVGPRTIFSSRTGNFTSEDTEAKNVGSELFGQGARQRERIGDALTGILTKGSGVNLSPAAKSALLESLLADSMEGKLFSVDRYANKDYGKDTLNREIGGAIANSTGDINQRNRKGSAAYRSLNTGHLNTQRQIDALVANGQADTLRSMGILEADATGNDIVNKSKVRELMLGNTGEDKAKPTIDVSGISKAGISVTSLETMLFKSQGRIPSIPVNIVDSSDIGEEKTTLEHLTSINKEGFEGTLGLLGALIETIGSMSTGGDTPSMGSPVKNGALQWLSPKSVLGGFGDFTKKYYQGAAAITTAMGGVLTGGLGGIAKILGRGNPKDRKSKETVFDIYITGDKKPTLFAEKLKKGHYTLAESGQVITKVSDVTGPVKDEDGNFVISDFDIEKGLETRRFGVVKKLTGFASSVLSTNFAMANAVMAVPLGALNTIRNLKNRPRDLYVKNDMSTPKMRKHIMENGGYFSEATEKRIMSPSDIDGPVRDGAGNIIISNEDIAVGIVDRLGTPIGGSTLINMAKRAILGTIGTGFKVSMAGFRLGNKIVGNAAGLVGKTLGMKRNGTLEDAATTSEEGEYELSAAANNILLDIFEHMQSRWPISDRVNPIAGDADGDGDRDGSWRDIMANKKTKEDTVDGPITDSEPVKEEKKATSPFASITGLITAGIGKLTEVVSGIASTILGFFAYTKAKDAVTGGSDIAGDILDGKDGKKTKTKGGKKGLFSKARSMLSKVAGSGVINKVVTGAKVAGSFVARKAIAGAAATVATIAGAPVLATGMAIASVGYTGYQAFKYFARRADMEPLEKLRYLQYGLNTDEDDDLLPLLRWLEGEIIDDVVVQGGQTKYTLSTQEALEKYAEDFGVDMSNPDEVQAWAIWFTYRFMPVFLAHYAVCNGINKNVDILDIDDEMAAKDKDVFIRGVNGKLANWQQRDPFSVLRSPLPGNGTLVGIGIIDNYAQSLLGSEQPVSDAVVKDVPPPPVRESAAITTGLASRSKYLRDRAKARERAGSHMDDKTTQDIIKRANRAARTSGLDAASVSTNVSGSIKLIMPCDGTITSPFGWRMHPIKKRRKFHPGVDIGAPLNTPVRAAADGVVYRKYRSKSYGNVIFIKHDNGMATIYAHLNRFNNSVDLTDRVRQGDIIGYMGTTGNSTGVHLHWGLKEKVNHDSKPLNPLAYVKGATKALEAEEKALLAESKNKDNTDINETLEGHDTMLSTPATPTEHKEVVAETKAVKEAKKEVQKTEAARNNSAMLQSSYSDMSKLNRTIAKTAEAQRTTMISNQVETHRLLKALIETSGGSAALPTTGNLTTPTQTTSPAKRVSPVVDVSDI